MATGSFVGVTPGTGLKLATGPTYSEGGQTVQDEKVILGEPYAASYVLDSALLGITAIGTVVAINAGASLVVRVHRITVSQMVLASAAGRTYIDLYRISQAATGGTAAALAAFDPSDPAAGATARYNSSALTIGTLGANLGGGTLGLTNVEPIDTLHVWEWSALTGHKPIIIPAGTTNGLVIYAGVPDSAAQVRVVVEFTETPY